MDEEVEKGSEALSNVTEAVGNDAENSQKISETFASLPQNKERTEHHTITVRQAARIFENAGILRTERSINNWCHPSKRGSTALDCFYDREELKFFITPQSIEFLIGRIREINTRGQLNVPILASFAKGSETSRNESEVPRKVQKDGSEKDERIKELEHEVNDLKITNKGKDYFIEQMKSDQNTFITKFFERMDTLETRLLAIEAPKKEQITEDQEEEISNEPAEPAQVLAVNES